jgi:hypothetical protein
VDAGRMIACKAACACAFCAARQFSPTENYSLRGSFSSLPGTDSQLKLEACVSCRHLLKLLVAATCNPLPPFWALCDAGSLPGSLSALLCSPCSLPMVNRTTLHEY